MGFFECLADLQLLLEIKQEANTKKRASDKRWRLNRRLNLDNAADSRPCNCPWRCCIVITARYSVISALLRACSAATSVTLT